MCLVVGMPVGGGVISREGGEYITLPDTWDLGYYGIQLASEWYASYWNAFLF